MRHRRSVIAGTLAFLLLLAAPAAMAAGPHRVRVIHGKKTAWSFHTGKCVRSKHRFTAVLGGEVKNPDYALALEIDPFTGFHDYAVTLGPSSDVFLKLFGPKDAVYSNFYKPPFPAPSLGKVTFSANGRLMGVGFGPAMFSKDFTDAVVLAGVVTCRYKKTAK